MFLHIKQSDGLGPIVKEHCTNLQAASGSLKSEIITSKGWKEVSEETWKREV